MPTNRPIAPVSIRRAQVKAAVSQRSGTLRVPYRGTQCDLPAGRISHEHLLFRLSNGRTIGEQRQLIAERSLPVDHFNDDANPQAQALQEEILETMAAAKGLLTVLAQQGQTEPLLISSEGLVINGNRRLAGMRHLANQQAPVSTWPYVEVAVLPDDITDADILEIEAQLQIAPDVKADYHWYDRGLLYERLSERGKSDADIATMYRSSDGPKEVRSLLTMLTLAREFLISIGKPDGYSQLEKHYYAFKTLRDTIADEPDASRRVLLQELAFRHLQCMAKAGRRYDTMPRIRTHLDAITNRIVTEAKLAPIAPPSSVVAALMSQNTATATLHPTLLTALRNNQVSPQVVAGCIDEVIDEEERRSQDRARLGALDEALALAREALDRALEQLKPSSMSRVTARSAALIDDILMRAGKAKENTAERLTTQSNSNP